jgi:hypothetical protein
MTESINRVAVQTGLGKKRDPIYKITIAKRAGVKRSSREACLASMKPWVETLKNTKKHKSKKNTKHPPSCFHFIFHVEFIEN